jgi:hypothetical protein
MKIRGPKNFDITFRVNIITFQILFKSLIFLRDFKLYY